MVIDYRDTVLALIKSQGPALPVQIAKEVRTEILMAGAMLSEMCDKGILKVSKIKVGGSPLYFIPGQEPMLLKFINHLNEKDRKAVELLQQEKVIRDQDQDALTRVCLRNIKDFAIPLTVTHDGVSEIFWKWQTFSDEEASGIIKTLLTADAPAPAPAATQQTVFAPPPIQTPQPLKQETPKIKPVKPKVVKQKPVVQQAAVPVSVPEPRVQPSFVHSPPAPAQTFLEDPSLNDSFYQDIQAFCDKANIKILEHVMVKNKQDYDLIIGVPSPVGSLVYYAKARNKLKLNDADLNAAFMQGQTKKLPAMLIAPGELSKKAQELLVRELRGVVFTRLG